MLVPLADADERCGAKAANLARLLRAGTPVPPGFVVVDAQGSDAWVGEIEAALHQLGAPQVAVRSSAPHEDGAEASFAGQLRSSLGLSGPAEVVDEIRRVAGSGTSARVVAYAARTGRQPPPVVPVIVQTLVRAEVAGVTFTRHPVTGASEVVVEAGRGTGEPVVGGTVTPWSWTVDGRTVVRRAGRPGEPLRRAQVLELAATGRRLEALLGCPQDVEWAIADGTTWVLQSRPITTLADLDRDRAVAGPASRRVLATGTPASPGTAQGTARVVDGLDDFRRFATGDVLVCRTTSPAWTPVLARAAAVVTEVGGLLAHAAIVAREFGIPAVLAVPDATSALRDGQRVTVDGTAGTVTTTDDQDEP
ncbi:PEP/pyruvate-binding domain-containing protein [Cellulomonas sp. SLBN-39]|uniref:PEP/pyruvate-binding domain-containing protein n=1 Tax=Cellulomonas sp. SLBN-39 TaxID=2768446 RepID=UPI0011535130|nr:PEP/pyruvate-binding domain-containing protein [Cellulomonas sp. SLBN-39]TQL03588.1 pyruvate,water dikinase [Cellulomonas sp. SLBN-39]